MAQKKNDEVLKDDKIFCSNVGSHYKQDVLYRWSEEDQCMVPYFGESYDFYEQIQLSKTQVDLDMIIKRAKAGDTSVLNVRNASYADVSELPDNLNDLHNLSVSIENNFNKLSPEVRKLFSNDLDVFSKAVADGSFADTIRDYAISLEEKKKANEKVSDSNV